MKHDGEADLTVGRWLARFGFAVALGIPVAIVGMALMGAALGLMGVGVGGFAFVACS